MTVYRILYCGHCKQNWQMRGTVERIEKTIKRTFFCPSCEKPVKVDWITNPGPRALESRKEKEPMWYDSEAVKFNKKLLGLA